MIFGTPLALRDLPMPVFNKVAIVSINFLSFFLLFLVFRSTKFKDYKGKIFFLMSISMLTWVNFAYMARVAGLMENLSVVLLKIAWFATPFLSYFTYLISIYLMKEKHISKLETRALFIVVSLFASFTLLTGGVISGTKYTDGILDIVYGPLFFPFLFVIFVIIVYTISPLFVHKLNKAAKAFLVGVIIFYFMNTVFNIALPVFFGITHLYFFGDYSAVFLLGFTAYAIIKHELFDTKVILTEALTILIWIVLLVKIFVSQSFSDVALDLVVLLLTVIFGVLLIRSVVREIKQRRLLEELTEKLKELDAQKDEFLNVAAHELRAPMTAIKGYLSMVMDGDGGKVPDKANEFLGEAAEGNDRLIRLVNNMLNISRIEEGRLTYDMGEVNLAEIVEDTYNTYRHEAEAKNIDLRFKIYDGVVDRVYVDRDRIHEVLSNLVSNAVKYTDKGSVVMKLYNPSGGVVRFEVTDSGPGISDEDKGKMFQRFQRAQSSAGKKLGSGLGLYVSKLLVEKFGGRIGFESSLGKGSTFWFELPTVK